MKDAGISSGQRSADDALVLQFGHLVAAAGRLSYILGRPLEQEFGISHATFEALVILARAGDDGLSMGQIAQEQVLSSGGVTRLIDRMEAAGLVCRQPDPDDRRGRRVRLTAAGQDLVARASRRHAENVRRYFLEPLPPDDREQFITNLRTLSYAARDVLPRLP